MICACTLPHRTLVLRSSLLRMLSSHTCHTIFLIFLFSFFRFHSSKIRIRAQIILGCVRFLLKKDCLLITSKPVCHTAQKMEFPIKDFFSKCDQIHSFLWIWSHLLKKSLIENSFFCAVSVC